MIPVMKRSLSFSLCEAATKQAQGIWSSISGWPNRYTPTLLFPTLVGIKASGLWVHLLQFPFSTLNFLPTISSFGHELQDSSLISGHSSLTSVRLRYCEKACSVFFPILGSMRNTAG